jgi:CRISPR-associated protein Cas1
MIDDLHILPKARDSWSHLYVEHCRVDQDLKAIALHDAEGKVQVPCAQLSLLMLGPGTSITHAAIRVLADHGCLVAWTGEEGVRFYASGLGETRSGANVLRQARMVSVPTEHMRVVRRMYELRFGEELPPDMTLRQIRGREGARVRDAYRRMSQETGVLWAGRSYRRDDWRNADPINRALSAANSCLYGVCHAAIAAAGYSPALGFIHTGKALSFVYDVADLYKTETSIPAAFQAVASEESPLEGTVRRTMRDVFRSSRLLARIVADLDLLTEGVTPDADPLSAETALPSGLWDVAGLADGGINYANPEDDGELSW